MTVIPVASSAAFTFSFQLIDYVFSRVEYFSLSISLSVDCSSKYLLILMFETIFLHAVLDWLAEDVVSLCVYNLPKRDMHGRECAKKKENETKCVYYSVSM